MDILVSRTVYVSCQAGPGIEPGPSALKARALPIELKWQTEAFLVSSFSEMLINRGRSSNTTFLP